MSKIIAPLQLSQTGLAGEYRVASELLMRGLNVFISRLDNGIDLMLADSTKIQVKSAHLYYKKKDNSYHYHFALKARGPLNNGRPRRTKADKCDFFVLWCIEANAFYIVPCEDISHLTGVDLFPSSMGASPNRETKFSRDRSKYSKYKERWDLLTK